MRNRIQKKFGLAVLAIADLRRQQLELLFKFVAIENIRIQLAFRIECAANDTDILELGNKRANFGADQMPDRVGDAESHFFWMDGEKQASAEVRNESYSGRAVQTFNTF